MKKMLVVIFSVMFLGMAFSPAIASDEISVTFSSKMWSKSLGPDGVIYHNEPVLQSDIFISLPKGFYFDIWHSAGLDDTDLSSNFGDELDFTLGWSGSWKEFGVDVGVIYIDGLPTFNMKQGDSLMPYVELNKEFDFADEHLFTPFVRLELLFPLNDENNVGDIFGGFKHSWQLSDRFSIGQKAYLLYDNVVGNSNSTLVGGYGVDLNWDIHEKITFSPLMFKATMPLGSVNGGRKSEVVVGSGLTFHF